MSQNKNYDFKFSIIMSIYNTEEYLREAVDSILNQDIGFRENVQIVMINDGSPDNSEEICLEYQSQFPENIKYIKKENGGLSSARNEGLKHVDGEIINFFDPDDILSKNTLSEVYKFHEKHRKENLALVAIPLVLFEAEKGLHAKYPFLGKENRVIDLREEPHNFILSSASAFYRREVIEGLNFREDFHGEEDTMFNFQIYSQRPKIGYVTENGVTYHYRRRFSANSMVDSAKEKPEAFWTVVRLIEETGKISAKILDAYEEMIIYEMRSRLKNITPEIFENEKEYEKLLDKYREFIDEISDMRLARRTPFITSKAQRMAFLTRIFSDKSSVKVAGRAEYVTYRGLRLFPLSNLNVSIKNIEIKNSRVVLEVIFCDYEIPNLEVVMVGKNGKTIEAAEVQKLNSAFDIKYGNFTASKTAYYRFEIPAEEDARLRLAIRYSESGRTHTAKRVDLHKKAPFFLNSRRIKLFSNERQVKFFDNKLIIGSRNTSFLKYKITSTAAILWEVKGLAWLRLFKEKESKYWLLNDRPLAGGDNAEAIFAYINQNAPSAVKENTYFVLDRNSPDFKRLSKIGNVVRYGSLKHKFLFINAKLIASSHLHPLFYTPGKNFKFELYGDLIDYKMIWLQHGATINNIAKVANRLHAREDAAVVAAHHEKKIFSNPATFLRPENLIESGFPRYDLLKNNSKNIITITPTWRRYLSGEILASGEHDTKDGFDESEYYKNYVAVLSSEKLQKLLEKRDLKLQFVLHPGMQGYAEYFKDFANDRILILESGDVNYRKIFSESKLLVTDYSSVFFDFAYLDKPVLFFQFDQEEFFSGHYEKGNFSYEKDAPGLVVKTPEILIDKILKLEKSNFKNPEKYRKRIDKIFIHRDKKNSERVYKAILELGEK